MSNKIFSRLSLIATILAFLVVVLGAYVRLSNAGLGCPDWPGCYGHLTVSQAQRAFEGDTASPLVAHKAWKEMIHRYVAGTLALLILALAGLSVPLRKELNFSPLLPWFLVGIVIFQALLGMWTVTLKLHPLVVMAHLLGGLTTLGLLGWMTLRVRAASPPLQTTSSQLRPWAILGLVLLILQIFLGGWMSANYASLACPDFPTCQGHWWPPMNFHEAFHLGREIGPNYEGGLLDNPARMTIHWMHRVGAVFVFIYLMVIAAKVIRRGGALRTRGILVGLFLIIQIALGVSNIVFHLPLPIATAHNAAAALLLLSLLALIQALPSPRFP